MARAGTVLYDADCGFCTAVAQRLNRCGIRAEVLSLQSVDLASLGVDAQRAVREMPFLGPDGSVHWGHRAWAATLSTGGPLTRVAGRLLGSEILDRPAHWLYEWVATHRDRLPGGTPRCALPASPSPPDGSERRDG